MSIITPSIRRYDEAKILQARHCICLYREVDFDSFSFSSKEIRCAANYFNLWPFRISASI